MKTPSQYLRRSLALALSIGTVAVVVGCAEKEEPAPVPVPSATDATNALNTATNALPPAERQPNPNP